MATSFNIIFNVTCEEVVNKKCNNDGQSCLSIVKLIPRVSVSETEGSPRTIAKQSNSEDQKQLITPISKGEPTINEKSVEIVGTSSLGQKSRNGLIAFDAVKSFGRGDGFAVAYGGDVTEKMYLLESIREVTKKRKLFVICGSDDAAKSYRTAFPDAKVLVFYDGKRDGYHVRNCFSHLSGKRYSLGPKNGHSSSHVDPSAEDDDSARFLIIIDTSVSKLCMMGSEGRTLYMQWRFGTRGTSVVALAEDYVSAYIGISGSHRIFTKNGATEGSAKTDSAFSERWYSPDIDFEDAYIKVEMDSSHDNMHLASDKNPLKVLSYRIC